MPLQTASGAAVSGDSRNLKRRSRLSGETLG